MQKHGLKADPVTTDAARILRVPGTFNRKTTPPKEVKLLTLEQDYDFEKILGNIRVEVEHSKTKAKEELHPSPRGRSLPICSPRNIRKKSAKCDQSCLLQTRLSWAARSCGMLSTQAVKTTIKACGC